MNSILVLKNIKKEFKHNLVLKDVSFKIPKGCIFAFLGANGAGKSTLLNIIMQLLLPTSGTVLMNDEKIIKQKIGVVFQENTFDDELTIYENLMIRGRLYNIKKKELHTRILNLAKELSLAPFLNTKYKICSGGQKRIAMIARALLIDTEIIIMDEATSGLDPLMQEAFYEILQEERNKGKTIFFSSHNLPEVRRLCHRIGIIKEGQLITIDTVDNLTRSNILIVTLDCDSNQIAEKLGARVISQSGSLIKFIYDGDIDTLISALQGIKISRLLVEEPSLEEIFMHYYQ